MSKIHPVVHNSSLCVCDTMPGEMWHDHLLTLGRTPTTDLTDLSPTRCTNAWTGITCGSVAEELLTGNREESKAAFPVNSHPSVVHDSQKLESWSSLHDFAGRSVSCPGTSISPGLLGSPGCLFSLVHLVHFQNSWGLLSCLFSES